MADLKRTLLLRNQVYSLDLSQIPQKNVYDECVFEFLVLNEGIRYSVYEDMPYPLLQSHKTVGIGFNMDRPTAQTEWTEAFGDQPSFWEVYQKKRPLSLEEVKNLFFYALKKRVQELQHGSYHDLWERLKPNERLAILDAYYQSPRLVQKGTQFWASLRKYVHHHQRQDLESAILQLKNHSNPRHPSPYFKTVLEQERWEKIETRRRQGLQNRRDVQAAMLSSFDCPLPTPSLTKRKDSKDSNDKAQKDRGTSQKVMDKA